MITEHFSFNTVSLFHSKGHHLTDTDEKALLYDYYANTLNTIMNKRNNNFDEIDQIPDNFAQSKKNFDEIDRGVIDSNRKRFFLERPRSSQTQVPSESRFHQIDHNDYQDFMKHILNDDRVVKRNFDEIDRIVSSLVSRNYKKKLNE